MKKNLSTIILVFIFFVGVSVFLYPTISDYWNSRTQSRAIVDYEKLLKEMTPEDYTAFLDAANSYNKLLQKTTFPLKDFDEVEGYEEILNVTGDGIMGYITIDKIKVELPIYHGISDPVLNVAVGHLEGSSLPVGGESTHAILSAHRGLPRAKLFTDLDKLEIGDVFSITVLDQVLTYEIDQILIVEPDEVQALRVEEGMDYCTLLTCTPYGINTHRLLVRGVRTETVGKKPVIYVTNDAFIIDPIIVTPVVAAPMLFILLIVLLVKYRTKERVVKGKKKDEKNKKNH